MEEGRVKAVEGTVVAGAAMVAAAMVVARVVGTVGQAVAA